MKNFLLALLVLASLASCGKNNKVGGTTIGSVGPGTIATSPIATVNTAPGFQTLAAAVVNNSFGAQYANYYNYYTEFKFGTVTNNCVTKDGWFGIDYQSCSSATSNPVTQIMGQIVIATKQAELNTILSKSVVFQQYGANLYSVRTSDNHTYQIRTDLPIQANPVYDLNNADGKAIQLISIK